MSSSLKQNQKQTILKINGKWVDLTQWKKIHPGGVKPLERYHERDATDAFISIHSEDAIKKLEKMKEVSEPSAYKDETTEFELNFRKFREELVKDGWFERNWLLDSLFVGITLLLVIVGSFLSYDYPVIGSIMIGLGMQQGGWIAHDYVHGRGKVCYYLGRVLGGILNGFSPLWWSQKHNTHHVHPNQHGIDDDIANDPILHLFIPNDHKNDTFYRKYQHFYYHFVYSFLYVSWRIQSIEYAIRHSLYSELLLQLIGYIWLALLPFKVAVGSVLIGGWFVAEVVTASHQSEELMNNASYHFIKDQFITTRDVHFKGSFSVLGNWFWGGMQFQLEHHLFPTMPKYRYQFVAPLVEEWAKNNNIEYKVSSCYEILKMNYETMKKFAAPIQKTNEHQKKYS